MTVLRTRTSLIVTCLLLLIAIWLASITLFPTQKKYLTDIQESVSGLKVGSRVEYNGVEVGSVTRIHINVDNPKLVDVAIKVDGDTRVTQGTVAMLAVNDSERGKPFIALKDDAKNLEPLKTLTGQSYPVIPSVPSNKEAVNVSLTQIARSLQQFNETVQALLSKDEIESFKQLAYSLQQVVGMLAENTQHLNKIIVNTAKASDRFGSLLTSGQTTIYTLQNEILPSTNRLMADMELLLIKADSLVSEISQNPSVVLRGKAPLKPGPSE